MAEGDITRIRSNIQGLNVLSALRNVQSNLTTHQLRLATGKRINSAGDDPAGLLVATRLDGRTKALNQIFENLGEAKNILSVAEGGLNKINDILVEMQSKIEKAASDSIGTVERQAISQQIVSYRAEIDSIAANTKFNGVSLLGSSTTFTFQTHEAAQTTFTTAQYFATGIGLTQISALTNGSVIDSTNYLTYLNEVTNGINSIGSGLTTIGSLQNRFTVKEDVIQVETANSEAAYNRIMNADIAREQLETTKFQVLSQTSLAMLSQANQNSSGILSLFR
jgi:flagellin